MHSSCCVLACFSFSSFHSPSIFCSAAKDSISRGCSEHLRSDINNQHNLLSLWCCRHFKTWMCWPCAEAPWLKARVTEETARNNSVGRWIRKQILTSLRLRRVGHNPKSPLEQIFCYGGTEEFVWLLHAPSSHFPQLTCNLVTTHPIGLLPFTFQQDIQVPCAQGFLGLAWYLCISLRKLADYNLSNPISQNFVVRIVLTTTFAC